MTDMILKMCYTAVVGGLVLEVGSSPLLHSSGSHLSRGIEERGVSVSDTFDFWQVSFE